MKDARTQMLLDIMFPPAPEPEYKHTCLSYDCLCNGIPEECPTCGAPHGTDHTRTCQDFEDNNDPIISWDVNYASNLAGNKLKPWKLDFSKSSVMFWYKQNHYLVMPGRFHPLCFCLNRAWDAVDGANVADLIQNGVNTKVFTTFDCNVFPSESVQEAWLNQAKYELEHEF